MRIDEVRASAFGPYRDETLTLSPGMNIFHGPNEAGKSSWFAALYAGLAGQRKPRANAAVQTEFASRHRPWNGSQWAVGVVVTLEDGSRLSFAHDLRSGESTIADVVDGQDLTLEQLEARFGMQLTTESVLDGTRLLGLNRHSARATTYIGQADVLRVLSDADELHEAMERAAASETDGFNADDALAWLVARRRELEDPSALVRLRADASSTAERSRAQLAALNDVITRERAITRERELAQRDVELLRSIDRWAEINTLKPRLVSARQLQTQIDDKGGPGGPVEDDQIRNAIVVLGAFERLDDPPPLPEGATAEAVAAELAHLPPAPVGDLAPTTAATSAHAALLSAQKVVDEHRKAEPAEAEELPTEFAPAELREFASLLESTTPEVDEKLRAERSLLLEEPADEDALDQAWVRYHETVERNAAARKAHKAALKNHAKAEKTYRSELAAYEKAQSKSGGSDWQLQVIFGVILVLEIGIFAFVSNVAGLVIGVLGIAGLLLFRRGEDEAVVDGAAVADEAEETADESDDSPQDEVSSESETSPETTVVAAEEPSEESPAGAAVAVATDPDADVDNANGAPTPPGPPPAEPDYEPEVQPDETPQQAAQRAKAPRLVELDALIGTQEAKAAEEKADRERLVTTLKDQGIDPTPAGLRALVQQIEDNAKVAAAHRTHCEKAGQLIAQRDLAASRLAGVLQREVIAPLDQSQVASILEAYDGYVAECAERAKVAEKSGRREELEKDLAAREQRELDHRIATEQRRRVEDDLRDVAKQIAGWDASKTTTAAESASYVRSWIRQQEEARAASGIRAELSARLDQLLDGNTVASLAEKIAVLEASAGAEPPSVPDDLDTFRRHVAERNDQIIERLGDCRGQRAGLSQALTAPAELVEIEQETERHAARTADFTSLLNATESELRLARDRARANIAPAVEARIRPWLPRVTRGRYIDATVSPDELKIKVTDQDGQVREAELLSQGTTEQVFLLLRVALAQVLGGGVEESAPIVLDDVTVQSDQVRTFAILELLHELSAHHQVVLFTQELEVISWALKHLDRGTDQVMELTPASELGHTQRTLF